METAISLPLWQLIIILLGGSSVGSLVLMSAILMLNRVTNKEPQSRPALKQVEEVAPPQPKPLSKKEADDLERLLVRQAGIRTTEKPALAPISSSAKIVPVTRPGGIAKTVVQPAPTVTDPSSITGMVCTFCKSNDIHIAKPAQTTKNGRILNYYRCGACKRQFVRWG